MDLPTQNFIGILQEICQRTSTPLPVYSETSTENEFHSTCSLKDWTSTGIGKSKKFAKQNAAKEMLKIIENGKALSSNDEYKNGKRSVSMLLEYSVKEKKEHNPLYSDVPKEGDAFCCKCSFDEFSAVGKGRSKKEAKENAAYEVVKHFKIDEYFEKLQSKVNKVQLTPIQELNIYCQKKCLGNPKFDEVETKDNNVTNYKVTCSVGNLKKESSWAHSKKVAKHEVATLLLTYLQNQNNTSQCSPLRDNEPQYSSSKKFEDQCCQTVNNGLSESDSTEAEDAKNVNQPSSPQQRLRSSKRSHESPELSRKSLLKNQT